jgi:FtsP/CotA-like multicopper oxidase with cupredoxin domain
VLARDLRGWFIPANMIHNLTPTTNERMLISGVGRKPPYSAVIIIVLVLAGNPLFRWQTRKSTAPIRAVRIEANRNTAPAGTLQNRVLTLRLDLVEGDWYPEADAGPSMPVYAFAEQGKVPQIPGPLIRVPQGTEIRVSVRNLLKVAAVLHGLHTRPGDAKEVIELAGNEQRELKFVAGVPGTYQYYASAGGDLQHSDHGRPFRQDSQLAGAFIVDPPGTTVADRIFVITLWRTGSDFGASPAHQIAVINGKSWPYTERLTYPADEPVRWRWINASDAPHPMHMHGSYFRVDATGDGESDRRLVPEQRPMVNTYRLSPGASMETYWIPPPGHWLFHCHFVAHMAAEMTVSNALSESFSMKDHGTHMSGMVLGITVPGKRAAVAAHGPTRKLRLVVADRAPTSDLPAGLGYQVEENGQVSPATVATPGPPLILQRGQQVEITVVNRLKVPTTVHWHGMELESYYDGVAGWGELGGEVTPVIDPGESFLVRFTPPRAGTFIYHTHLQDWRQLSGGLYGALIVVEPGTKFDPTHDEAVVLSRAGPGPSEGPLLFNGSLTASPLHWRVGERYRLRFISIAPFDGVLAVLKRGDKPVQWRAIAKDGADLPPQQAILQTARQATMTGETFDFEYRPTERGNLELEISNTRLNKVVQAIEVH